MRVFLHGVPDTKALWAPLLRELGLPEGSYRTLNLPGFGEPLPQGFKPSKEAYAEWLSATLEEIAAEHGPLDVVGHDWGALLSSRVACLKPELFRTLVLSGAVLDGRYPGHTMAHLWNTPIVGEAMMALTTEPMSKLILSRLGMPPEVAEAEAKAADGTMKSSILALYRSANALRFSGPWIDDLEKLQVPGCLIWGVRDPYIPPSYPERFANEHGWPLHMLDAGHWVVAQAADEVAPLLTSFWATAEGDGETG